MAGQNGNRGNEGATSSRISHALSHRVLDRMSEGVTSAVSRRPPLGLVPDADDAGKMHRMELLDLKKPEDKERWQVIHNDHERYEVISERFSTVRADSYVDYMCLIIYFELGDDLPLVKVDDDLREDDEERIGTREDGGFRLEEV